MIPTYTTPVVLPKICLAFDWPTQMKIPRTAPATTERGRAFGYGTAVTQTRTWPTQTARVIPMIPTYTTPVALPKICLAFDWPTRMKIPRTAPAATERGRAFSYMELRSAGVGDRRRRKGRQVEHVARLVFRPRVEFVHDELSGGVFRQAAGVSLDQRRDHQLAVGHQTGPQRLRLDALGQLVVLGVLAARQPLRRPLLVPRLHLLMPDHPPRNYGSPPGLKVRGARGAQPPALSSGGGVGW